MSNETNNESISLAGGIVTYVPEERLLLAGLRRERLTIVQNSTLLVLAHHAGNLVTYQQLGDAIDESSSIDCRSSSVRRNLGTHISSLRGRLGSAHYGLQDPKAGLILNMKRQGWMLVDPWLPTTLSTEQQ